MSNFRVRILPVLGPLPAMVSRHGSIESLPVVDPFPRRTSVRKRCCYLRSPRTRWIQNRDTASQVSLSQSISLYTKFVLTIRKSLPGIDSRQLRQFIVN